MRPSVSDYGFIAGLLGARLLGAASARPDAAPLYRDRLPWTRDRQPPSNGARECVRRVRQIEDGRLRGEKGLAKG